MRTLAATLIIVAVLLLPGPLVPLGRAQAADLEGLLRMHYQALNRGDVDAAVASFASDAVLIRGTCTPLAPCRGSDQIRVQVRGEIGDRVSYGLLSSEVAANTVTDRAEFWNVNFPPAGVQRAFYKDAVTFKDDKITRWVQEPDLSDAQTVVF